MSRQRINHQKGIFWGFTCYYILICTSCTLFEIGASRSIGTRVKSLHEPSPFSTPTRNILHNDELINLIDNKQRNSPGKWGITMQVIRGGGQEEEEEEQNEETKNNQKDNALKSYVASVELQDELHGMQKQSSQESPGDSDDENENKGEDMEFDSSDEEVSDQDGDGSCTVVKEVDAAIENTEKANLDENIQIRKANAVGDPDGNSSDDSDDTDEMSFLSDEEELVAELVEKDVDEGMHVMMTDAVLDVEDDILQDGQTVANDNNSDACEEKSFDEALVHAFMPFIFVPPNQQQIQYMRETAKDIDMDSRRRLDRRTLYRGLLLELMPQHHSSTNEKGNADIKQNKDSKNKKTNNLISNRKYLDEAATRTLTAILSLATQPKWRRHVTIPSKFKESIKQDKQTNDSKSPHGNTEENWWWKGGLRLYADQNDLDQMNSATNANMNVNFQNNLFATGQEDDSHDENSENLEEQIALNLPMQETIALSLAHSLGCGMFTLDDETFASIRDNLIVDNPHLGLATDSADLKPARLLSHLLRLANSGQFMEHIITNRSRNKISSAKLSSRMERDFAMQLDDIADEIANESLQRQLHDEEAFEKLESFNGENEQTEHTLNSWTKHLPLVLFLNADGASSLLKSKSAVERLAKESQNEDNIHLLMLGKGMSPHSDKHRKGSNSSPQHRSHVKSGHSQWGDSNPFGMNNPSNMNVNMNLPFTPGDQNGSFHSINMPAGNNGNNMSPFSFGPNNNASGVNDPEGSRRFNIFLGRTQDKDGNPGIMGAIAPPQAGNLFPHMFAMQQRQNAAAAREEGNDNTKRNENINKWNKFLQEQMNANNQGQLPSPQFFNASIASPFGLGEIPEIMKNMNNNNNDGNQFPSPLPEIMKRVIQQAMTSVIDRLAEENSAADSAPPGENKKLPPHLAKAFAEVLSNENLRRGIAENLARAAPALVDPRCQGVMLSVYVPPPNNHPNRGMMPGGTNSNQNQQDQPSTVTSSRMDEVDKDGNHGPSNARSGPNVGSWLNKILQQNPASSAKNMEQDHDQSNAQDEINDESHAMQSNTGSKDESNKKSKRRNRRDAIRTLAAAASAIQATKSHSTSESKQQRGLLRLQSLCKNVPIRTPTDPVRARGWDGWKRRERGSMLFRKNKKALLKELNQRKLKLKMENGKSAKIVMIRQMLSVRDVTEEISDVVKAAIEIEAARSQRLQESPWNEPIITFAKSNTIIDNDVATENNSEQNEYETEMLNGHTESPVVKVQYIHPSSIESALSAICRLSTSGTSSSSDTSSSNPGPMAAHRSREDILALAQDKHERALVSQVVSPQDIGVNYDMIGGLSDVKELLRQSITYPLKFPHLYSEGIAREAVKGVLLFGPPGTGKTMLAKAVATEGCASFLSVDASSVENKWLGESEKNAKAVFTLARRLAPCVIFLDEVDSLLSSREGSSDDSAHGTLTSVKTTMMSEWDGLNSGTNGKGEAGSNRVVVIGSTNRPFDLDEAVLRRFPRRILVDLPDLETRQEILEVTLSENRLDPSVNFTLIAEKLEGYTGSDIKEVCREAVVQISHEQARMLDLGISLEDDFDENFSTNNGGDVARLQRLRPVRMKDFENALSKLKRSVSEKGRELARVWEWNDEYGEIKKKNKKDNMAQMMNMFL